MAKEKENEDKDDLYLLFQNDAPKFPSLKKELIYDMTKDRYYLYEKSSNKFYSSNFFGKKIVKINNSKNLGKLSYKERVQKNLIDKVEQKFDDKSYIPKTKYFDGFSQIPRPLDKPFLNFNNDINLPEKKIVQLKSNMMNYIKNKEELISDNKYKEFLSRNSNKDISTEEIKGLNYYSNSVADTIRYKNKSNKNKVIKIINNSMKSEDLNNKQKTSLKKFKNILLINSNNPIKSPAKLFRNKYRINSNVILINPLKYSQPKHDSEINSNSYRMLYNSINNNKLTRLIDNRTNEIKKRNKNIYNKHYRPNSVMNIRRDNKIYLPEKQPSKNIESVKYDTEDNSKDNFNNKKNIHSLGNINKEFNKEKKFIGGYTKPIKKRSITLRKGNPKFKSGKELYKKELDLFKLVNPQKLKMEEKEIEKRNIYLKRKIEKDRKIKVVKDKISRGKASRLDSAISNLAKDLMDNGE